MSGRSVSQVLVLILSLVVLLPLAVHADSSRESIPFDKVSSSDDGTELKATIDPDTYYEARAAIGGWRLKLPLPDREALTLELERFDNVAPDARFLIGSPSGDQPMPKSEVVMFRGRVADDHGSFAYLAVSPSGMINGFVDPDMGYTYSVGTLQEDLNSGTGLLTVQRSSAFEEGEIPFCGVPDDVEFEMEPDAGEVMAPALEAGPYLQRVAIDSDQGFAQLFASTLDARDYIVQLMGAVSSIYERDNNVRMVLAYARLWPFGGEPFNVNDLGGFRSYWWNNEDTTGLNIVHMFGGTRPDSYGGVAYYSNTCDGSAYGIDGSMDGSFPAPIQTPHRDNWDLNVVAHEMGHNHRAHHTHDSYFSPTIDDCGNGTYSRGTIMSYCHSGQQGGELNVDMRFHRRVQEEISQHVWTAGCHPRDCNGNNVSDAEDISLGTSLDVNSDGIPDECQDCNSNGTLDPEDIALGAADFDNNGVPDECEEDCNSNNIPDQYETWVGLADDDDGNNVPDECDPDCDGNGILDYTDIRNDLSLDIDLNAVLDECQDCLGNGNPDWVDADRSQFLYVCDAGASAVKEYHPVSGRLDRTIAGGNGLKDITPSTDGAYLYIADNVNGVLRMDPVTGTSSTFVAIGSGGLLEPWAVCIGPGGDILVADYASDAIRRYNGITGAYVADFVASAASPLTAPSSLVYSPGGTLLAGDVDAVYEYNGTTGAYIGPFVASGSGGLSVAAGLAYKKDGNLLVSSYDTDNLLEFDGTTGSYVGAFNDPTVTIDAPWGVKIGFNGNILLACLNSSGSGRIYEYLKSDGSWLFSHIYGTLTGPTGFCYLPATATDVNGNMIPDACEAGDADGDGVIDLNDNCPYTSNSLQTDTDSDGIGDACDNCPAVVNVDQRNGDGDGYGDECDNCPSITNVAQTDSDGDGRGDGCDNCEGILNADQTDSDGDFIGDPCDACPNDLANDSDGDGLCGDVDNCPLVYNPDQTDDNSNGWGDVCEPEMEDVVSTSCLDLAVSSRGNVGAQGSAGSTMDYLNQGDCEHIYLYDGSPVVAWEDGGEFYAYYTAYGRQNFQQLIGGTFAEPTATTPDYQVFKSGQFQTLDGQIGLEMAWYAPDHPDSCHFVIQELSVFPADGQPHTGLAVGQATDWDVPSEYGSDNLSGYDAGSNLIYQYGLGTNCEDNTTRFGGQALLGVTQAGETCVDVTAQPHGAYTALNSVYVYPTNGFVPQEIYNNMQVPGFSAELSQGDQHAVTTYFNNLSLAADDTVTVYLVLATLRTGTSTDLVTTINKAKTWLLDHIGDECSGSTCCIPPTVGDCDQSGAVDITDVSVLIDNQFLTLTPLVCEAEGDVDFSGVVDITDLSVMIDNQFLTLTPLLPCP